MKRLLLTLAVLMVSITAVWAQFDDSPELNPASKVVTDGKSEYILGINVEGETYFYGKGNAWGTRTSVKENEEDALTVRFYEGVKVIDGDSVVCLTFNNYVSDKGGWGAHVDVDDGNHTTANYGNQSWVDGQKRRGDGYWQLTNLGNGQIELKNLLVPGSKFGVSLSVADWNNDEQAYVPLVSDEGQTWDNRCYHIGAAAGKIALFDDKGVATGDTIDAYIWGDQNYTVWQAYDAGVYNAKLKLYNWYWDGGYEYIDDGVTSVADAIKAADTVYNKPNVTAEELIAAYNKVISEVISMYGVTGNCGTNVTYTLTETGVLKIEGTGAMSGYSENYVNGTNVTTAPWGDYSQFIKSVTISEGVTSIGDYAFLGCRFLPSITIPSSVTSIGRSAFYDCNNMTELIYNAKNATVYSSTGSDRSFPTSLTTVTIGNSVETIPAYFVNSNSNLSSVTIPSSVTRIGDMAFQYCSSLTDVTSLAMTPPSIYSSYYLSTISTHGTLHVLPGCGDAYRAADNWKNFTIEEDAVTVVRGTCGEHVTWALNTETGVLKIEGTGAMADYSSSDDVPWASCRSYVKEVIIAKGVTSVGSHVFRSCTSLTSATIPEGVTRIESCAFDGCYAMTSVNIPEGVTSIGYSAFYYCPSLTSITIPSSVTSIGYDAFDETGWYNNLPDGLVYIRDMAYRYKGTMPANTSVAIKYGTTVVCERAFWSCPNLVSVTIPQSVTNIVQDAFWGCSSLTTVTIPENVKAIGNYAFWNCSSLADVICLCSTPPAFDTADPFSTHGTLHVLPGCGDAYRAAGYWNNFTIVEDATVSSADIAVLSNAIYTSSTEVRSGEQIELPILMKNANEVSGFEFDLELPEGVTVPEDEDGFLIVDQSFERTTTRKTNSFDATKNEDGSIHVECCLKADQSFTGNDGEVCVIKLQVDEFAQSGSYPLLIKNVLIKGLDGSPNTSIARVQSALSIRSEITLADGTAYTQSNNVITDQIAYTRTFTNGNWQALYVPIEISTDVLAEQGLEVARINNVNQYDHEDDGTVDETTIEIFKLRHGSTKPNTAYMIRAKETGEKTIVLNNATLYAAEENSHSVTSWDTEFTFVGTYHTITGQEMLDGEYFAMGGGVLHQTSSSANDLKPQRWYMTVTDREGNKKNVNEVKVFLYGEEDLETGIVTLYSQPERGEGIFDLSGRKTSGTQKGLYIKNGKVVIRK